MPLLARRARDLPRGARVQPQLRRELGLPPLRRSIFDFANDADLYLQSGVPSFDYPRTDLPDNVHYIGAPIPEPPAGWTPPLVGWWRSDLRSRPAGSSLVTQGTINNDFDQLIRPAIRALGGGERPRHRHHRQQTARGSRNRSAARRTFG